MKYIKSLFVLALVLLLGMPLYAQWNGVNTEVTRLRNENNTQEFDIGTADNNDGVCYEWFGPGIRGENNKPVIRIHPTDDETVYLVRRKHSCGVEEGQVVVRLVDTISLVSVTPKRGCYNLGEKYNLDDFIFETKPENYGHLVQLYGRDTAYVDPGETAAEDVLQFVLPYNHHVSSKSTQVRVYNTNNLFHPNDQTTPQFEELKSKIDKIKGMIEAARAISNLIQGKMPSVGPPCQPGFDFSGFSLPIPNFFASCCKGDEITGFHVNIPKLRASLTLDCEFLWPGLGIPGIGGVYVIAGGGISAEVGPSDIYFRGLECISGRVPIDFGANVYLGLKIQAVDADVFHASLRGIGSAQSHMVWVIGEQLEFKGLDLSVDVEGEIVLFSLVEIKAYKNIGNITLFKD